MLTFDPTTTAALAAVTNKNDYSNIIKTALGSTRRRIAKRVASGTFDWSTATLFDDCDMTGGMNIVAGNIRNLGVTSNQRTKLAADLATGTSRVRISNAAQSRWVEGTPALLNSVGDWFVASNPNGTKALGFVESAGINAPLSMSSGIGPNAPVKTSDKVHTAVIWLRNGDGFGSGYTEAGRFNFTDRRANYVYSDNRLAQERGDNGIYFPGTTVTVNIPAQGIQIEVGGMLILSDGSNSETGDVLEEVFITQKPTNWVNYPFWAAQGADKTPTYNQKTISTYLPAFRIELLDQSGNHKGWIRMMEDEKDINDPTFVQDWFYDPTTGQAANPPASGPQWDATHRWRPHVNCKQLLFWRNVNPKQSTVGRTIIPGLDMAFLRNSMEGSRIASNPLFRQLIGNSNSQPQGGHNHFWLMPEWNGVRASTPRPTIQDPNRNPNISQAEYNYYSMGWRYERGCPSQHDWITGYGGVRNCDRATIPTAFMIFQSDPDWVRLEGGHSIKDMALAYADGYFNLSGYPFTDPRTWRSVDRDRTLVGDYMDGPGFYGGNSSNLPSYAYNLTGTRHTPSESMVTLRIATDRGKNSAPYPASAATEDAAGALAGWCDARGRYPFHQYLTDAHHTNQNPGVASIVFRSCAYGLAQQILFHTNVMSWLGESIANPPKAGMFLGRVEAWRWLNMAMTWMFASDHECCFTREQVEGRMRIEFEKNYTDIVGPALYDGVDSLRATGLRNFGLTGGWGASDAAGQAAAIRVTTLWSELAFYHGQVHHLLRTINMEPVIRGWSVNCARVYDAVITCLDKSSVDWILDTDGRYRVVNQPYSVTKTAGTVSNADTLSGWTALTAAIPNSSDWLRDETTPPGEFSISAKGSPSSNLGWDIAMWMPMQWVYIRNRYFQDYPNPRAAAAQAKFQGYWDEIETYINSLPIGLETRSYNDFANGYPGVLPYRALPA